MSNGSDDYAKSQTGRHDLHLRTCYFVLKTLNGCKCVPSTDNFNRVARGRTPTLFKIPTERKQMYVHVFALSQPPSQLVFTELGMNAMPLEAAQMSYIFSF
jgi:hypothetical protein